MNNTSIKMHWQMAVSMNPLFCKICRHQNNRDSKFYSHGFAMELCQQQNTYPIFNIPHYQQRLRGLIRKHYKEHHPEYKIL